MYFLIIGLVAGALAAEVVEAIIAFWRNKRFDQELLKARDEGYLKCLQIVCSLGASMKPKEDAKEEKDI